MSAMYFAFTGWVLNLYGYLISEIRDNPAACLFPCLLACLVGWLVGSQVFVRVLYSVMGSVFSKAVELA